MKGMRVIVVGAEPGIVLVMNCLRENTGFARKKEWIEAETASITISYYRCPDYVLMTGQKCRSFGDECLCAVCIKTCLFLESVLCETNICRNPA